MLETTGIDPTITGSSGSPIQGKRAKAVGVEVSPDELPPGFPIECGLLSKREQGLVEYVRSKLSVAIDRAVYTGLLAIIDRLVSFSGEEPKP